MADMEAQIAANQAARITANQAQQKFETFIVGLNFSLLALSVQTAKFAGPPIGQLAEILGWGVLLVAGVLGLTKLEWAPAAYIVPAESQQFKEIDLQQRRRYGAFKRLLVAGICAILFARGFGPVVGWFR